MVEILAARVVKFLSDTNCMSLPLSLTNVIHLIISARNVLFTPQLPLHFATQ